MYLRNFFTVNHCLWFFRFSSILHIYLNVISILQIYLIISSILIISNLFSILHFIIIVWKFL